MLGNLYILLLLILVVYFFVSAREITKAMFMGWELHAGRSTRCVPHLVHPLFVN